MNYSIKSLLVTALLLFGTAFGSQAQNRKIVAAPAEKPQRNLFALSDVRLLESHFKTVQELDHDYLLTLDPDRLLSFFRREAGLTPKAEVYPFWEGEDAWGGGPLAGHILGFYLSSMSMMYDATGDEAIRQKVEYLIKGLDECQKAQKDGYLLATVNGRHVFEDVVNDNFTTNNPTINGVWEPVYVMNKIMLGLYNAYLSFDNPLAKEVLVKMADWFGGSVLDKLNHEQIQKLLVCEHGSINESFVDVYSITGDAKYIEWANELNDEDMWVPASEGRDVLYGWHANTQIPKFTGFQRLYTYTKEKKYHDAALFFWNTVVNQHTCVFGGNSTGEHFFPIEEFERRVTESGGPESCNSVNMMRLTEAMYCHDAGVERINYYERVLFNHILANYDLHQGMCTYYTSMRPGQYKIHSTKYDSFWCCTGTGMEAPAKFGKMIYAYNAADLYVNLFIPSRLNWKERGVTLVQETVFPNRDVTEFTIQTKDEANFTLNIRNPQWNSSKKLTVSVNGKKKNYVTDSDGYARLQRTWKNNDKVKVEFSPLLTIEKLNGSDKYVAMLYGPIVLAAKIDNGELKVEEDFRMARRFVSSENIPLLKTYALIGDVAKIKKNIARNKTDNLSFTCPAKTASGQFELVPFNTIQFNRYEVYFPLYRSRAEYDAAYAEGKDEADEYDYLVANTTDRVKVYLPESEAAHSLNGVNMNTGESYGRRWRDAGNGGYIMYRMNVSPDIEQNVWLQFIKYDEGERIFDILVDGNVIATLDHCKQKRCQGRFYYEKCPIPIELTKGKKEVTVKLQARNHNAAGGIFDIRIVK